MRQAIAAAVCVVSLVAVGCAHKEEVKPEAPPPASLPSAGAQAQGTAASDLGDLAQWNGNHPDAARGLCLWASQHQEAARLFFQWDADHTDDAHTFVSWSIANAQGNIEEFVRQHRGWQQFDTIMERHRPAAEAFMRWTRQHPAAAEQLMGHPGGLQWAGQHPAC